MSVSLNALTSLPSTKESSLEPRRSRRMVPPPRYAILAKEIDERRDRGFTDFIQAPERFVLPLILRVVPECHPRDMRGLAFPVAERLSAGHWFVPLLAGDAQRQEEYCRLSFHKHRWLMWISTDSGGPDETTQNTLVSVWRMIRSDRSHKSSGASFAAVLAFISSPKLTVSRVALKISRTGSLQVAGRCRPDGAVVRIARATCSQCVD